jgi:hypothetical protein
MTATVLTDATIYADGFDYTTHANSVELSAEVDDQDITTFGGNGWKQLTGGLRECSASCDIFWQSAAVDSPDGVDAENFSHLGHAGFPFSVGPTRTEGDTAYFFKASSYNYELLGDVGDVSTSSLQVSGTDTQGLIRGKWAKIKGNVSAVGAIGSAVNLGAVSSTQFVYAVFHIFSVGTTLSWKLESDTSSGFATPANVGSTQGPFTTRGGTYMTRVAGPITDSWFRFNLTACTGTFSVAGAIAVQ